MSALANAQGDGLLEVLTTIERGIGHGSDGPDTETAIKAAVDAGLHVDLFNKVISDAGASGEAKERACVLLTALLERLRDPAGDEASEAAMRAAAAQLDDSRPEVALIGMIRRDSGCSAAAVKRAVGALGALIIRSEALARRVVDSGDWNALLALAGESDALPEARARSFMTLLPCMSVGESMQDALFEAQADVIACRAIAERGGDTLDHFASCMFRAMLEGAHCDEVRTRLCENKADEVLVTAIKEDGGGVAASLAAFLGTLMDHDEAAKARICSNGVEQRVVTLLRDEGRSDIKQGLIMFVNSLCMEEGGADRLHAAGLGPVLVGVAASESEDVVAAARAIAVMHSLVFHCPAAAASVVEARGVIALIAAASSPVFPPPGKAAVLVTLSFVCSNVDTAITKVVNLKGDKIVLACAADSEIGDSGRAAALMLLGPLMAASGAVAERTVEAGGAKLLLDAARSNSNEHELRTAAVCALATLVERHPACAAGLVEDGVVRAMLDMLEAGAFLAYPIGVLHGSIQGAGTAATEALLAEEGDVKLIRALERESEDEFALRMIVATMTALLQMHPPPLPDAQKATCQRIIDAGGIVPLVALGSRSSDDLPAMTMLLLGMIMEMVPECAAAVREAGGIQALLPLLKEADSRGQAALALVQLVDDASEASKLIAASHGELDLLSSLYEDAPQIASCGVRALASVMNADPAAAIRVCSAGGDLALLAMARGGPDAGVRSTAFMALAAMISAAPDACRTLDEQGALGTFCELLQRSTSGDLPPEAHAEVQMAMWCAGAMFNGSESVCEKACRLEYDVLALEYARLSRSQGPAGIPGRVFSALAAVTLMESLESSIPRLLENGVVDVLLSLAEDAELTAAMPQARAVGVCGLGFAIASDAEVAAQVFARGGVATFMNVLQDTAVEGYAYTTWTAALLCAKVPDAAAAFMEAGIDEVVTKIAETHDDDESRAHAALLLYLAHSKSAAGEGDPEQARADLERLQQLSAKLMTKEIEKLSDELPNKVVEGVNNIKGILRTAQWCDMDYAREALLSVPDCKDKLRAAALTPHPDFQKICVTVLAEIGDSEFCPPPPPPPAAREPDERLPMLVEKLKREASASQQRSAEGGADSGGSAGEEGGGVSHDAIRAVLSDLVAAARQVVDQLRRAVEASAGDVSAELRGAFFQSKFQEAEMQVYAESGISPQAGSAALEKHVGSPEIQALIAELQRLQQEAVGSGSSTPPSLPDDFTEEKFVQTCSDVTQVMRVHFDRAVARAEEVLTGHGGRVAPEQVLMLLQSSLRASPDVEAEAAAVMARHGLDVAQYSGAQARFGRSELVQAIAAEFEAHKDAVVRSVVARFSGASGDEQSQNNNA